MGGEMPGGKSQTGRLGNRAEKGRAEIPANRPEVLRMIDLEKARALAYQASEFKVWTPPGATGHGADLSKHREWQAVVEICDKRYPEALDQITDLMQNCNSLRTRARKAEAEIERLRLLATFPKSESGLIAGLCMAIRKTEEQAAEIERLRAELASANVELLAAGELVTRLKRVREAEIDQAGAAERMYLEGIRAKDARIKELEALRSDILGVIRRPKTTSDKGLILYLKELDEYNIRATKRVGELEDALAEERAQRYSLENTGTQLSQAGNQFQKRCLRSARNQLQIEGKIGPDAAPRSWQITDERRRALSEATTFLPEEYGGDTARIRNVLRTMLEEVGQ
jgi:hypothetical protein